VIRGSTLLRGNVLLIADESTADVLVATLLKHGFRLHKRPLLLPQDPDPERQNQHLAEMVDYVRGSDVQEVVSVDAKIGRI
jgi:hypothetical protein